MINHPFYIGEWQVTPSENALRKGDTIKQLEPKAMDVLVLLCKRNTEVLSADTIIDACWGNADVGDNPVHKAITQIRKSLGDKASAPTYIETIRKRGYRVIASLSFPFEQDNTLVKTVWRGGSPFPGLSAFESKNADVFFGRSEQVVKVIERISQQVSRNYAFTLILGPSGVGKSSLINAGILPVLCHPNGYNGFRILSHVSIDFAVLTASSVFLDIAGALLDWEIDQIPIFEGYSATKLATVLQEDLEGVIAYCQKALALNKPAESFQANNIQTSKQYLSICFERLEIFLSSSEYSTELRQAILQIIERFACSGCILVISACRNEFYPLLASHPILMAGKSGGSHFDLEAPDYASLSQMIRLPASAAQLSWEKDAVSGVHLDEMIVKDAFNNPDALPMLQYTLQQLYLRRNDDKQLLINEYNKLGGLEGAIGQKAEEVYNTLPQNHQQEFSFVLSLLVSLQVSDESITSKTAYWSQLNTANQRNFVQAMIESRLFTSHLFKGEPCFSVAHEALLRCWPRANQWIAAHRENILLKRQLHEQSTHWLKESKSKAFLLSSGKPLQQALLLKANKAFTLEPQEHAYIDASKARSKQNKWLKQAVIALLCGLTILSVGMSYKSQQVSYLAQQKQLEAENLLGFMVGEFADKLRSVRRMDLLDGISNKAIEYFAAQDTASTSRLPWLFDNQVHGFNTRFQHSQTLAAMGEVAYSRGKTDEARQAFEKTSAILQALLLEHPNNLELLRVAGANAFWLGQLDYDDNNLKRAETFFLAYYEYSQRMHDIAPESEETIQELSDANSTLGALYFQQFDYLKAKASFSNALNYANLLPSSEHGNGTVLSNKAGVYNWLAEVEYQLGNLRPALVYHQEAQALNEEILRASPNDAYALETLAYSLWYQSLHLYLLQDYKLAAQKAAMAHKVLSEAFYQDQGNKAWQEETRRLLLFKLLLSSYNDNTLFDNLVSDLQELSVDKVFWHPTPTKELIYLTRVYQKHGRWDLSNELLSTMSDKYTALTEQANPTLTEWLRFAEFKLLEAKQYQYKGKASKKIESCHLAKDSLVSSMNKSNDPILLLAYVRANICTNTLDDVEEELEILENMGIVDIAL
ncbi:nSTAND1 domain-containing NTPase [Agaribacter flavus]|uniref:Winged helix-turn-helix domain-containing protein n=1 Tax=Agaribacter flavus TaxID=1902781 RepID=A0ABV7FN63_9ALTE